MSEGAAPAAPAPAAGSIPGIVGSSPVDFGPSPLPPPEQPDDRTALQRLRAKMTAEVEAASKGKPKQGPDGKFLPKEDSGEIPEGEGRAAASDSPAPPVMNDLMSEGEVAPQVEPVSEGEGEDQGPGFEFAGEKFKDQKAAEDKYKTVRGMIKAADARARQALETLNGYENYLASLPNGTAPQQQTEEGQAVTDRAEAKSFVEGLGQEGWATYENLRSEKGETFANAWLQDSFDKHLRTSLESLADQLRQEFQDRYPYLEEQNANLETINNVSNLWEEFQGLPNDAGDAPRYPELQPDQGPQALQQTVKEIGRIWKQFVERADPQTIRDPYWMDQAIERYRSQKAKASSNGDGGGGADNLDRLQRAAQQRNTGVLDSGAPLRESKRPAKSEDERSIERLFTKSSERQKWGFDL